MFDKRRISKKLKCDTDYYEYPNVFRYSIDSEYDSLIGFEKQLVLDYYKVPSSTSFTHRFVENNFIDDNYVKDFAIIEMKELILCLVKDRKSKLERVNKIKEDFKSTMNNYKKVVKSYSEKTNEERKNETEKLINEFKNGYSFTKLREEYVLSYPIDDVGNIDNRIDPNYLLKWAITDGVYMDKDTEYNIFKRKVFSKNNLIWLGLALQLNLDKLMELLATQGQDKQGRDKILNLNPLTKKELESLYKRREELCERLTYVVYGYCFYNDIHNYEFISDSLKELGLKTNHRVGANLDVYEN